MAHLPMPFPNPSTYPGHSGVDFAQPAGTPILASGPGRIVRLSHSTGGGYWTVVKYDGVGPEIGYAHQPRNRRAPAPGTRVAAGTRIGTVGSTGNSTGPHVHVEILGIATYAAVWNYFTRSRVVGRGSATSGNVGAPQGKRDVKNRQKWLNKRRGESLKVDGIAGPATKAAIERYQSFLAKSYGYKGEIDGIWGGGTQSAHQKYYNKVTAPPAKSSKRPTVRRGSKGATVKLLQRTLKKNYPLYAGKLATDGVFGPATERAVKEFQRRSGITVDGVVGPATWGKLGV